MDPGRPGGEAALTRPILSLFLLASVSVLVPALSMAHRSFGWRMLFLAVLLAAVWALSRRMGGGSAGPGTGRTAEIPVAAAVILAGLALRAWNLGANPPGPVVDEAVNGLQGAALWSGLAVKSHPSIPYPNWPVWWLLEAASTRLGGVSLESIRIPAAVTGLATVFLAWRLARGLFGRAAGLAAAAFLAFSFWHLQLSRIGVACIMVVLDSLVVGWLLLSPGFGGKAWPLALAGLYAGVACTGYPAAQYIPVWAALVLAVFPGGRGGMRERARALSAFLLPLAAVLALGHSSIGGKAGYISAVGFAPLAELLPRAAWSIGSIAMWGDIGWSLWGNFPAGAPRLSPVELVLFLAGLAALAGDKNIPGRVRWGILLWIPAAFSPEFLSRGGMHFGRCAGALAPIALAASLAPRALGGIRGVFLAVLLAVAMLGNAGATVSRYFRDYPRDKDVRSWFLAVTAECAGDIRRYASEGRVEMFPLPAYENNPIMAMFLWDEIRDGRVGAAVRPDSRARFLRAYYDPVNGVPVLFLYGARRPGGGLFLGITGMDEMLEPGVRAEREGRLRDAEKYYRELLATVAHFGQARARLAMVLFRAGRNAEATRELARAGQEGVRVTEMGEFLEAYRKAGKKGTPGPGSP